MTPTSTQPDVADQMASGARRQDFASHVKAQLRSLKARLDQRTALIEALREVNAVLEPQPVGAWLAGRAGEWLPAPCWAVVAADAENRPAVIADLGLVDTLQPSVMAVAQWVMTHGVEFMSANLAQDARVADAGRGTALAFPLRARNRTVGALVGLDAEPSAEAPALDDAILDSIGMFLEAGAIALDHAIALQRAEALSVTDDLTGLFNSRYLNLVMRREEKRSLRTGRPLSLLFIDMDGFKNVNTHHGHLAGSKALVEAAGVIKSCARETDIVARFGGDEFAVVLPETGPQGAVSVAERICERIRAFRFLASDGLSIALTASIGVATLPDAASSAEELLRAADRAMYGIKDAGKNGFGFAEKGTS